YQEITSRIRISRNCFFSCKYKNRDGCDIEQDSGPPLQSNRYPSPGLSLEPIAVRIMFYGVGVFLKHICIEYTNENLWLEPEHDLSYRFLFSKFNSSLHYAFISKLFCKGNHNAFRTSQVAE